MGEPEKDKSLRGSRDGFVETIVFNTALIRRRIRDPHLVMEITEAGQASRTDIAICYMKDRVDKDLLANAVASPGISSFVTREKASMILSIVSSLIKPSIK